VFQYVAQAGLELSVLLPQPPECWDYRDGPPHLVFVAFYLYLILGIQLFIFMISILLRLKALHYRWEIYMIHHRPSCVLLLFDKYFELLHKKNYEFYNY
jgi:hypothetical protein